MNDTIAETYVDNGEPAGLRRIMGLFGSTKFYRNYLKQWKIRGPFLQLLDQLKSTAYSLQGAVEGMTESLDQLREQLAKTNVKREAAERELEKATLSLKFAKGCSTERAEKDLKDRVAEMRERGEKMKRNIEELEAQVRDAQQKYRAALEKIRSAHEEGTSFLESWNQDDVLDELRAGAAEAHDLLLSSRIETDKAEQAYQLAMAKVSEAEQQQSQRRSPEGRALPSLLATAERNGTAGEMGAAVGASGFVKLAG